MEKPYTHTTWHVKPGREGDFVERWTDWVEWSHLAGLEASALLLRDVESPGTFVSFGVWEDLSAVGHWRTMAGYHERVGRLAEVVEHFEPRTLEVVARG